MARNVHLVCLAGVGFSLLPAFLGARELADDALRTFPSQISRVEFSSWAKIRETPGYQNLLKHYSDSDLRALEASLAEIGLDENDIDELVVGWGPSSKKTEVYGIASGRFHPEAMAKRAVVQGTTEQIGGRGAFCSPDLEKACIIVLNDSELAIGTRSTLRAMMEARTKSALSARSNKSLQKLALQAQVRQFVWGVAVGTGVADCFRSWMSNQKNMQTDWVRTLEGTESMTYGIQSADHVYLNLSIKCVSSETAVHLEELFKNYRFMQRLAWRNRHHGQPNPVQATEIGVKGLHTLVKITMDFAPAGPL
jgi:hypothetical protein